MLTIPHCKESLSRAYVTAVVGRSRNSVWWGSSHDYGVDGTVKKLKRRCKKAGSRIYESGFGFDFQLKTTVDWSIDGDDIVYDLGVDAYNDMAERAGSSTNPMYLILLCLTRRSKDWLQISFDEMKLQQCAFYFKVSAGQTQNTATKRIRIPQKNVFRPATVRWLLSAIEAGSIVP